MNWIICAAAVDVAGVAAAAFFVYCGGFLSLLLSRAWYSPR